ncbi:MAG: hypothetical protein HGA75_14475 [Thiobacillus sp.]|nr:hypothetical protein [Thiobacillus sp.]
MRTYTQALLFAVMTALTATTALARDRDDNPPGPAGGPGTNWENPRGPAGGPGASPDVRNHHHWLRQHMTQAEWRHFMTMKYQDRHRFCVEKHIPKARCWVDRDDNPTGSLVTVIQVTLVRRVSQVVNHIPYPRLVLIESCKEGCPGWTASGSVIKPCHHCLQGSISIRRE